MSHHEFCSGCWKCEKRWAGMDNPVLKSLTIKASYYILEVDTLVEDKHYDNPHQLGLKAYSVIKVDENGAHEVDRAYRNVKEALRAWPEAMPPANN